MNINLVTQEEFQVLNSKVEKVLELLENNKPTVESEWLKSSEVKKVLKCSDASLKNYRDTGILPSSKIGGTYYYAKAEVDKMLLNRMQLNNDRFCEDDSKS